jgi:hypothetical protein
MTLGRTFLAGGSGAASTALSGGSVLVAESRFTAAEKPELRHKQRESGRDVKLNS